MRIDEAIGFPLTLHCRLCDMLPILTCVIFEEVENGRIVTYLLQYEDGSHVHSSLDYDSTASTRSRVRGIPTIFNFKYLA